MSGAPSDFGDFAFGESPFGGSGPAPPPPPPSPSPIQQVTVTGSPGLLSVIPSYIYQEYSDDDDLQAFAASFNGLAQQYINWFNQIGIPIYTGALIVGTVLDWIGLGLYGIARPVLPSGQTQAIGPFNTWTLNQIEFNGYIPASSTNYFSTNDDYYKRVITWHFHKSDGKYFCVSWLKRRVLRFLIGTNGTAPNVSDTSRISVTFAPDNAVTIRLVGNTATITGGSLFNMFTLNGAAFNATDLSFTTVSPYAAGPVFKAAVDAGVLELPFQYTFTVQLG